MACLAPAASCASTLPLLSQQVIKGAANPDLARKRLVEEAPAVGRDVLVREALEDFEYMRLAAKRGRKADVDAIVGKLVRSFQDWDQNPQACTSARAQLAELIISQ